jgi:two-component system NtrC family response regulator
VELVADRFVVGSNGTTRDLSTGKPVELIVSMAGGVSEQARWAARCQLFAGLHHRHIAPLIDYGTVGDLRRFEAWGCHGAWTGGWQAADRAIELSRMFLRASGLADGALDEDDVRESSEATDHAVVLPTASAGYEQLAPISLEPIKFVPEVYGVSDDLPDRGVESVAELFAGTSDLKSLAIGFRGTPGAGVDTALRSLARMARLNGFVPVTVSEMTEHVTTLIGRRSLFLIAHGDHVRALKALAQLAVQNAKPHIILVAGVHDVSGMPTVRLKRCSAEPLVASVRPRPLDAGMRRRALAAARRCDGLPDRFRELFWGLNPAREIERRDVSRASERAEVYGIENQSGDRLPSAASCASWSPPADVAVLRRRLAEAVDALSRGRHAPGERATRQVVAALARRQEWTDAARGGLALSRALVKRGRLKEARTVLEQVAHYARHEQRGDVLIEVATTSGVVATDETRLGEAEATLQAALTSARGLDEQAAARSCVLALARCLFWRARFDESHELLDTLDASVLSLDEAIRLEAARSRAAIGCSNLQAAVAHAGQAVRLADRLDLPGGRAAAACASALAHLAVGDHAAVESNVTLCQSAARLSHDPLLGLRATLLGIESARQVDDHARAAALMRKISRIAASDLPPILRARVTLTATLLEGATAEGLARQITASGLRALRLFAPSLPSRPTAHAITVDGVLEILHCCQTSEDDVRVLASVCQRLRSRLRAAGVAFFAEEGGTQVALAWDGARCEAALAARVRDLGQTIAPSPTAERIGGGAPVRYGGLLVGTLVARWTIGSSVDSTITSMLLTTAATAAAPAMAGVLSRRQTRPTDGASELLGVSQGIEEVRLVISRAAAAPFPVLIEGESGSGKELVARALHRRSPRRDRPYCTVNCAALPDDLVESELFGHARGAFTGAVVERPGVFEQAHTGTLFLDEIGELSLRAQAKVLRSIQESEVRRVGENLPRRVDVRLIAATNRDLRGEVQAGRFRLDLLYRLDVLRLVVPPLRERREDVSVLAEHFWREATERVGSKAALSAAAVAALARHDWPGNVRELQNVLAALAVRSPKRGAVPASALPSSLTGIQPQRSWRLVEARHTFETGFVRAALVRSGGHRGRAAEELGITRQGLTKLMTRLGIEDSP